MDIVFIVRSVYEKNGKCIQKYRSVYCIYICILPCYTTLSSNNTSPASLSLYVSSMWRGVAWGGVGGGALPAGAWVGGEDGGGG